MNVLQNTHLMALTSLSFLLPEGNIWGKALPQLVNEERKLILRRIKPKVLKVAGNFFALKRERFTGERKTTEVLYLGNSFFSGHSLSQKHAKSLQVVDIMCMCLFCLFLWHSFYFSLLLYLLQLLSPCTTQLYTSHLVGTPPSCVLFRVHVTTLSMPFCVCVCLSPAFT